MLEMLRPVFLRTRLTDILRVPPYAKYMKDIITNKRKIPEAKISKRGIEADKDKVDAIEKILCPTDIKGIRSFLGHVGFQRRFIKDFSKISRPVPFVFDDDCLEAFEILKKALISAPIVQPPNWNLPFEIMCDASDYAVGAVLGQRVDKK